MDQALTALGRQRRVVMSVNQYYTAGRVVTQSDLLSVLPLVFLPATGHEGELLVRELPFDLGAMQVSMLWHMRRDAEPAHRWLRERVRAVGWGRSPERPGQPSAQCPAWPTNTSPRQRCSAGSSTLSGRRLRRARRRARRRSPGRRQPGGHDSHGVGMVPRYVLSLLADELSSGAVRRSPRGRRADHRRWRTAASASRSRTRRWTIAIERAQRHGVCVMGLKNAHHIGRVGHWAEQAVAAGMVSIHFTNVNAALRAGRALAAAARRAS